MKNPKKLNLRDPVVIKYSEMLVIIDQNEELMLSGYSERTVITIYIFCVPLNLVITGIYVIK